MNTLRPAGVCAHHRHQCPHAQHVDHPLHVVCQDMQAHLSAHLGLGFSQELCRVHPCFDGAEWMLDRLPAYSPSYIK